MPLLYTIESFWQQYMPKSIWQPTSCKREIPCSTKFLHVFNFANFANFQLFAKIFQHKFLPCGVQCVGAVNSRNYFNAILALCSMFLRIVPKFLAVPFILESSSVSFSGFSVGFCINEESYLLPTIAQKITCRREEEQSSQTFDLQWCVSSVVYGYK